MLRTVLTMSFYGSLAGLAALALSLGMRHIRASRGVVLAVWALAGLRLLCPLELTSGFSVWQTAPWAQTVQTEQKAPTGGGAQAQIVQDGTAPSTEKGQTQGAGAVSLTSILTTVWAGGVGLLLLWGGVSYVLFRRRLRFAVRLEKSVYEVDTVSTPCVAGFLRPKVYLPVGLTELQRRYTVAHERAHIRNGDHLWKLASYLILSIHWFNPLVWVQYRRFQQDLEMACDERVLKGWAFRPGRITARPFWPWQSGSGPLCPVPLPLGRTPPRSGSPASSDAKSPWQRSRFWRCWGASS